MNDTNVPEQPQPAPTESVVSSAPELTLPVESQPITTPEQSPTRIPGIRFTPEPPTEKPKITFTPLPSETSTEEPIENQNPDASISTQVPGIRFTPETQPVTPIVAQSSEPALPLSLEQTIEQSPVSTPASAATPGIFGKLKGLLGFN